MKNIGYYTTHSEQMNNGFMTCNLEIGQNLLTPIRELKKFLEKNDCNFETIDVLLKKGIVPDLIFFADVPNKSIKTIINMKFSLKKIGKIVKYYTLGWSQNDILGYSLKHKIPTIVRIYEPSVVWKENFVFKNYKLFNEVISWDTTIKSSHLHLVSYSQVKPEVSFEKKEAKKTFVLMNSNKNSKVTGELYSLRRKVINYFENKDNFDLFGFGWEKLNNYRGISGDKIATLSEYDFCFCFENFKNSQGYITEKIFDCFFADVIPIYYGCDNISDFIPKECYIDYGDFTDLLSLEKYCIKMSETEKNAYIRSKNVFLESKEYFENFDYKKNAEKIGKIIIETIKK